jgi:hypothetical protein
MLFMKCHSWTGGYLDTGAVDVVSQLPVNFVQLNCEIYIIPY